MLDETLVGGVKTNLAFLHRVLAHPAFASAELDTGFILRHEAQLLPALSELPQAFWQLAADAFIQSEPAQRRPGGDRAAPELPGCQPRGARHPPGRQPVPALAGQTAHRQPLRPDCRREASHHPHGGLTAPMNGSIVRVLVELGQAVEAGTALVVLEAMKMEHSIRAPEAGTVKAIYYSEGELVGDGTVLVELS